MPRSLRTATSRVRLRSVVWWIVVGLVLAGLALLALVGMSVVSRLGPLRRAQTGLQRRAQAAQELQGTAEALQVRMAALQERTRRRGDDDAAGPAWAADGAEPAPRRSG